MNYEGLEKQIVRAKEIGLSLKVLETWTGRQGTGHNSTLFLNGRPIADVTDEARGGNVNIRPIGGYTGANLIKLDSNVNKIKKLEAEIASLPEIEHEVSGGRKLSLKDDLESLVTALFCDDE